MPPTSPGRPLTGLDAAEAALYMWAERFDLDYLIRCRSSHPQDFDVYMAMRRVLIDAGLWVAE